MPSSTSIAEKTSQPCTVETSSLGQQGNLQRLRSALHESGMSACMITSGDPHLSANRPAHWQSLKWAVGFTGSAGTLILTSNFVGLWVDARYFESAQKEVAAEIKVFLTPDQSPTDWLASNLLRGTTVNVCGLTISDHDLHQLKKTLDSSSIFVDSEVSLLDQAWQDRAKLPSSYVYEHEERFACESRASKLQRIRSEMSRAGADHHFISSLDDIAWIFNLRGGDSEFSPLFMAHALINQNTALLFVDGKKISITLRARLALEGVRIETYNGFGEMLAKLPERSTILIDPTRVCAAVGLHARESANVIESVNSSQALKSRKSLSQLVNVRKTMELDGAALCQFFAWLEETVGAGTVTELDIADKLLEFRAASGEFISPSFGTIAAFNANGAMPHYQATQLNHSTIRGDGLLLIDSGGQYLGGTTDITRMVAIGTPSEAQRDDCTTVLKGLIALSNLSFPEGVYGFQIDAIARAPLWGRGLDFAHSTGHGVGYFLNVHEGPQSISKRILTEPGAKLAEGMITSIEPGVYRPGRWGVRIENLVANAKNLISEFGSFLRFETLTLCPIDVRCLNIDSLTDVELSWLNAYHRDVYERLSSQVTGKALAWLKRSTIPLSR